MAAQCFHTLGKFLISVPRALRMTALVGWRGIVWSLGGERGTQDVSNEEAEIDALRWLEGQQRE